MSQYMIGLDIGTTSTKSVVFDSEGNVIAKASVEYPLFTGIPGCAEQDPDEIYRAVIETVSTSIKKSQVDPKMIHHVSFSSAMHSLIAVNHKGEPITKCITWADSRSYSYAEEIKGGLSGREIYLRTGTPIHPMAPLSKIRWLVHEYPETAEKAYKFISIKEYVFFHFFGEYVVDYSIASATGLFNLKTLDWDPLALQAAGITKEKLSTPVPTTHILRGLKSDLAEILGLEKNTLFIIGASDGVLSNLGVNAIRPGVIAAAIGTSGAVRMTVDQPMMDSKGRTFCYALTEKHWVIGGAINNGGIMYRWARDELGGSIIDTAKRLGKDPYQLLSNMAERVQPGSNGLVFLPFFTGERAPYWNANARGIFFGLTLQHKKEHLIRAVLEGVIYAMWSVAEVLSELSGTVTEVKATGGFVRSPLWTQIMADVFGQPISIPVSYESSCLGAAILGMKAAGQIDSFEITEDMIGSQVCYQPIPEHTESYQYLMEIYKRVYHKLTDEFDLISTFQKKFT